MRTNEQLLVFLPATEPGRDNYGEVPERIALFPELAVRQVHYPQLVWYNREVQDEAERWQSHEY